MTESNKSAVAATITGDDIITASLTLTFANGEIIQVNPAELSTDIRHAAMMHGFKQKLVDAAAIARNTETGKSATVADKHAAVLEVYNRLVAGQWNKTREGGASAATGGIFLTALTRLFPSKTVEQLRAYIDGLSKEQVAALKKTAKVAAMMEVVRAERAKSGDVDGDELLAGLEDAPL